LMERIFQECVEEVKKEGKAVLLSSHILQEVERLCDKVSIIKDGQVIETGTMTDLRHLTRTSIHVETKRSLEGLEKMPGIHDMRITSKGAVFAVETKAMNDVLRMLTDFGVAKLECSPPTLEELFMSHYKDSRG